MSDLTHNEELKKEHLRRLAILERYQARFGYETKPEILTEIEQIKATIVALDKVVSLEQNSDLPTDRRQDHRLNIMIATVQSVVAEVSSIKIYVKDEIAEIKDDAKLFQHLISDSFKTFHDHTASEIKLLRRTVIGILIGVVLIMLLTRLGVL